MIAYIEGPITHKSPTFVYLDVNGVGYHINISLYTFSKIEKVESVKLWTYLHIKEDAQTLYGFFDQDERSVFVHLISVSGIGPNTARLILSSMSSSDVRQAIAHEAVMTFNKVKGVGPKTAKRIILDLKEKIIKEGMTDGAVVSIQTGGIKEEAQSALIALGFQRNQVAKAIDQSFSSEQSVEDLIKKVLQQLSR